MRVEPIDTVASVLERDSDMPIQHWLTLVLNEPELTSIPLSADERTHHLSLAHPRPG
jgi:hypothetical protein